MSRVRIPAAALSSATPGKLGVLGADERLCDPSTKAHAGAFNDQRQRSKTPRRTPWLCTAFLYSSCALLADLHFSGT